MALLAVVAIGCMILFGRFAWYVIAGVIGGGLVIKYAADIAALIT